VLDSLTAPNSAPPRLTRGLILLFAAACGIAVANLYYAQPILNTVARSFGASAGTAGLIVTFSQVGYAAGLALLVPLGDLLTRRRLIPVLLAITAVGLVASAVSPAIGLLIAAALVLGAGSVAAQLLIPMAAAMAADDRRGQVVGTVMSGLLLGILLARTVSGAVASLAGWRVVYVMGAALTLATAAILWSVLPAETARDKIRYRTLLATTVRLFMTERVLRRRAGFGALGFAAFSVLWTTIAFLLAGPPYHYGDVTIGLFGLVGAAGALCANFAGRWVDRELGRVTTMAFALCIGLSFLPLWYGRHNLALLIVGILVLDVGVQGLQVTNQSLIYRLAPNAHSRVNSAYMVCYFAGGAVGSAVASSVYDASHWTGVCLLGAAIGTVIVLCALPGLRPAARPSDRLSGRPSGG
jgi:predicted MFS family arabinose efflux permease